MNKDFRVEPNREVLLNYFSVDLHQMDRIKDLRKEMLKVCKDTNSTFEMFYLFGAADVLLLGISDTCNILRKMQETRPYRRIQGVMDYFAHYGTVLSVHPTPFDFNDALRENKILGIINWKIRHEVWLEVFQTHNSLAKIRNSFAGLLSKICEQSFKESEHNVDYKVASILSSGCEDIILVVLTNSLQFPKLLSARIRSIELDNLIPVAREQSDIKHVTVSTYTILGAQIKKDDFIYEYPQPAVGKQVQDQLKWNSCFNVRPGHLRNTIETIENKGPKGLKVYPTAGRHDLIAHTGLDKTHTSVKFLQLHHRFINALRDNLSILSSETYLFFPNLRDAETARAPAEIRYSLPVIHDINQLRQEILESPDLHVLEKESFAQIVRKLQYLLEDRYLRDSFMTLTPIIFYGVGQYIKIKSKKHRKKHPTTPNSDLWTSLIELCFATRYKGSPAVGETAVCPTMGDYSTGPKCLTLLDLLGNRIIKSIIENCKTIHLPPIYVANISINSYIAATVPAIPIQTAFILLPPKPLFYRQILMLTFCHELGHVVFNSFCLHLNEITPQVPPELVTKIKRLLKEPLAELFSVRILSGKNFDNHEQTTKTILDSLLMEQSLEKDLYREKRNHIKIAKFLYENVKDPSIEDIIRGWIIGKDKVAKKDEKYINFAAGEIVKFIDFLYGWNDEIIPRVRTFFTSQNTQEEFWNLWIHLYTLGAQCYLDIKQK